MSSTFCVCGSRRGRGLQVIETCTWNTIQYQSWQNNAMENKLFRVSYQIVKWHYADLRWWKSNSIYSLPKTSAS